MTLDGKCNVCFADLKSAVEARLLIPLEVLATAPVGSRERHEFLQEAVNEG